MYSSMRSSILRTTLELEKFELFDSDPKVISYTRGFLDVIIISK